MRGKGILHILKFGTLVSTRVKPGFLKSFPARFIVLVSACTLLYSCAVTPLETVMNRYHEAPACCKGYSEFNYEKLIIPDSKVFWLNEESKAFIFDTGKSYFKAFELPVYSSPYSISIRSYKIGQTAKSFYIFSPAVMFLDERFNVTRFLDKNVFQYHRISLFDFDSAGNAFALEGEISVVQENARERYMVILTTDGVLAKETSEAQQAYVPIIIPGFVSVMPTGRSYAVSIPHSPAGKIKIVVHGLRQ